MLIIIVGGIISSYRIHRELYPSFATDKIQIQVEYPDAQPQEIEEAICIKIEEAIQGVNGIREMRSVSQEGLGDVTVYLEPEANSSEVLDELKIIIDSIDNFPEQAEKPKIISVFVRLDIIEVDLYGDIPLRTLKELARSIKNEITALPEITQVEWDGVQKYEIAIELSEWNLQKYKLTFSDIVNIIKENSNNFPGGTLWTEEQNIKIQVQGRRYKGSDYGEIVAISNPDGTNVFLKDIAKIYDFFDENKTITRFNRQPASRITVYAPKNKDSVKAAQTVKDYVTKKQKSLPENVQLIYWNDRAQKIQDRQDMLLSNGLMGFALVVICLAIFLDFRLSFWVALGIPVSFAGGIAVLWLLGQTLNLLSLLGLIVVLGMVVDDAIVVGESVRSQQLQGKTGKIAAVEGAHVMALPIIAASLTTIIAFLPLYFVPGAIGKWANEIPTIVIIILIVSLIESLLILPFHLRHISEFSVKPSSIRQRIDKFIIAVIDRVYLPVLGWSLKNLFASFTILLLFIIFTFGLFRSGAISYVFLPNADAQFVIAKVSFPQGTPLHTTESSITRLEQAAEQINSMYANEEEPPVEGILSTVSMHEGEVFLILSNSRNRLVPWTTIAEKWSQVVGEIPGATAVNFESNIKRPGGKPIEIHVISEELDTLKIISGEVKEKLSQIQGLYNIKDNMPPGKIQILPILKDQGRTWGISEANIGQQLTQGFAGEEVLVLQRGPEEVKVRVRYAKEERRRLEDMASIQLRGNSGESRVPLSSVAELKMVRGLDKIHRYNRKRLLIIYADISEKLANAQQVIKSLQQDYVPSLLQKYPQVKVNFGGQQKEKIDSNATLKSGFLYALLAIFVVLVLIFGSYLQPILIALTIPLGCLGAIVGHWIMGYNLTTLSLFGMIALSGIVINDSLVFTAEINSNLARKMTVIDALLMAGKSRFRAIVLTSLTTCLGMISLIFEQSSQGRPFIPIAISITFGLIFSTVFILLMLPVYFLTLNLFRRWGYWLLKGHWLTREQVEPAFSNSAD